MRTLRLSAVGIGLAMTGYGLYGLLTDGYVRGHQLQVAMWAAGALVLHDGVWIPLLLAAGALLARWVPDSARTPVRIGLITAAALTAVGLPAVLRENDHNGNATLLPLPYLRNWLLLLAAVAAVVALALAAPPARRGYLKLRQEAARRKAASRRRPVKGSSGSR